MFERYTEKAKRVIFFARYEASQFGSLCIDTEHLLLGLLREDKALTNRFLRSYPVESIRKQIEQHTMIGEKVSTSVDLPVSNECKRALGYAVEEADRLGHQSIGTEHLLLGLLREEKCYAADILHERGLRLSAVREALAQGPSAEELVEDEPVLKAPDRLRHNRIRDFIVFRLRQFLETSPLGEVVVNTEFQLRPQANAVRVPDVAFVTAEQIKEVNADLPVSSPPTLAIEIVSPDDGAADLVEKIDEYLRAGALSVWVIYPNMLEAHIFRSGANPRILRNQELLSDEKLLPGFSLPLNAIFD